MEFKLWLENNHLQIPINKLVMTKSELLAAIENIARGYPSMTEGPVTVADMGRGLYHLVNGYHRMIPIILSGFPTVNVDVDKSLGKHPWPLPTKDRFKIDFSLPYKGLEKFVEPYSLRRI